MHNVLRIMKRELASKSVLVCVLLFAGWLSLGCGGDGDTPDTSADGAGLDASQDAGSDVETDSVVIPPDAEHPDITDGLGVDVIQDVGTATGICDFWKQDCVPGMNCYMTSIGFECMEPTGESDINEDCEEQTDCNKGLICFEENCAMPCSIDELVAEPATICVDDCEDGFEQVNLDLQIGKCTVIKIIGHWEQILPDNITKEHVFKGIWMSSEEDINLVGADGIGVHYQGLFWDIVTEGYWDNFNGVWGFASDDVWGVGIGGQILHFNGVNWTEPGGCGSDLDCDDDDDCTIDSCTSEGICEYQGTGEEGCCGDTVLSEGWDGVGLAGWTAEDLYEELGGGVVWNVTSYMDKGLPRYVSPPNALYFGNPNAECVGLPGTICPNFVAEGGTAVGSSVTSPPITLPVAGNVTASFEGWIDTEAGTSFDRLSLNVLVDGLTIPVWEKSVSHAYFVKYTSNLSSWAGQTVQLQFFFDSVDGAFNETEGVYIDNFQVSSECGTTVASETFPTLFDVWGPSSDSVYAVGVGGVVAHYDGASWSEVNFGASQGPWDIQALQGFGSTILAVGADGLILSGGTSGSFVQQGSGVTAALLDVWGETSDDVYAVGEAGTILHNTGAGWIKEAVGSAATLKGVYGAGSFEVLAVGEQGTILRRTDGLWIPEASGVDASLNDVWALGSKNAWAVGAEGTALFGDGSQWIPFNSGVADELFGVSGRAIDDVWAAGQNGAIVHYDGSIWTDASSVISQDWYTVQALPEGKAVVAGELGLVILWDGEKWNQMTNPFAPSALTTVWGNSLDDLFAAGNGFILHYDGNEELAWTVVVSTINVSSTWRGVCGSGPDNVLVVGVGGNVIRWNGNNWGSVPVEPEQPGDEFNPPVLIEATFYGCWAWDENTAWIVGEGGLVLELIDGQFKKGSNEIPVSLRKVYAPREDLVFAIGIEGIILFSEGVETDWQPIYSGSVAGLFGIHGTSLEDITAVGDLGTILRFVPNEEAFPEEDDETEVVTEEEEEG